MLTTPFSYILSNSDSTDPSVLESEGGIVEGLCVIDQSRATTLACEILDISATGARLGFEAGTRLPGEFILQIKSENVEVTCERVWVSDLVMGVRFLDKFKPIPIPEDQSSARFW